MSSYDVAMNNRAVELLQFGFPGEAIDILRLTLSRVKDSFSELQVDKSKDIPDPLLARDMSSLQDSNSSLMDFSASEDSEDKEDQPNLDKAAITSIPIQRDNVPSGSPYLFDGYVKLYDRAFVLTSAEQLDKEIVASVVLFNMALINHSRGILSGKTAYLERSLELYKMSLNLYQKSTSDACMDNLVLAILNNAGHIYSEIFAFDEMHQCLNCMRDILEEQDSEDEVDDYCIFHLNSIVYSGCKPLLAPAA